MRRRAVPLLVVVVGLVLIATAAVFAVSFVRGDRGTSSMGQAAPGNNLDDPGLDPALSEPREDSNYPDVGDPGVDALHYDLDLAWDREARVLTGTAEIVFRSTADDEEFQLDLSQALDVGAVSVDGSEVAFRHRGKDLVVEHPVATDERYLVEVDYSGTPEPTPAPTTRSDFSDLGLTITPEGDLWTMQEPFGAFTWYPVNDHPSDKAFYDFTITAPAPQVGVANGELVSREQVDGETVTRWHLDTPASSYLVTLAVSDYEMTADESASGVPLTYWTSPDQPGQLEAMRFTPEAVSFLEQYLGPYPFSSLGSVVVDSRSAMETQAMITYGNTPYALSPDVVVHEVAHQWYGNTVTPSDWRDLWMNEGMAMYLQGIYEAEATGRTVDELMDGWASYEPRFRKESGPPGDYDPATFGQSNAYYGPALMWHELRQLLGDQEFWAMVRKWPTVHPAGNATREEYLAWIQGETGRDLAGFFHAWLMGEATPPRS